MLSITCQIPSGLLGNISEMRMEGDLDTATMGEFPEFQALLLTSYLRNTANCILLSAFGKKTGSFQIDCADLHSPGGHGPSQKQFRPLLSTIHTLGPMGFPAPAQLPISDEQQLYF